MQASAALLRAVEALPRADEAEKISFPAVIYEPTFIRWAPRSGVPASLTTKDACTEHEIRLPEKTCRFTQFRLRERTILTIKKL